MVACATITSEVWDCQAFVYRGIRMNRQSLVPWMAFVVLVWAGVGCGSDTKQVKAQEPPTVAKSKLDTHIPEPQVGGPDEIVKKFDLNKDKRADLWKVYKYKNTTDGKRVLELVRIEIDLNGDGKIDVRRFYKDNNKTREEFDLDFDGRFDVMHFYDDNGNLYKKAYFMRSRDPQRPDLIKYYEVVGTKKDKKVVLVRKERDDNLDGRIDYWEYWENGVLERIGRDTDFDGTVDVWEKGSR